MKDERQDFPPIKPALSSQAHKTGRTKDLFSGPFFLTLLLFFYKILDPSYRKDILHTNTKPYLSNRATLFISCFSAFAYSCSSVHRKILAIWLV